MVRPFTSKINAASAAYQENYRQMSDLVEKLNQSLQKSAYQGEEKHIQRAQREGKMLARQRIDLVLDPDSPFLELLPLAGIGIKGANAVGGTAVVGIGLVCGVICVISASVGTIKGGSIDKVTLQKSLRVSEICMENRLPIISLVESSGANLPEQAHIFNYGGISFREITRRSKAGIPSIAVVFGNSTAGGAYIPGMSDYVVMVKKQAKVFLAGPPLVKMATNEVSDDESLGGAEMHSRVSGVSDFLAENELDAIRIARDIIANLKPSQPNVQPTEPADEPLYPAEEILGVVQADIKKPYDSRELIARVVDGSRFTEFKPDWGSTLVTGWATIHGYPVGIIANNGVLFSESANKGAHFIQLCNKQNRPLIFLQNITGFMVGREYEEGGIIKDGAKLINAVSNSGVPAITIMIGASYGAGNYAMCGRSYQPRFLFSYPNTKLSVMGGEQLAGVMEIIQREAAAKAGKEFDENQAAMLKGMLMNQIDAESNAYYATAQNWDDGLIDPRDTRTYLGICLAIVYNAGFKSDNEYGVFRM